MVGVHSVDGVYLVGGIYSMGGVYSVEYTQWSTLSGVHLVGGVRVYSVGRAVHSVGGV